MIKKKKILIICGLTASGKTTLALKIANKLDSTCIISADSRQAYQGLPILSGQDIPLGFTRHQTNSCKFRKLTGVYFSSGSVNIWGVDQVPSAETLNISDFTKFVWRVIKKETQQGKSIIIVGGTGLYLKALTEPMLNIHMGFNENLRKKLSRLSVEELTKKLNKLNSKKLISMNNSDKLNPRRLIRAIEILTNPYSIKPAYLKMQKNTTFRWVGLKPSLNTLESKIHARVLFRLNNKAINEVKALNHLNLNRTSPIYTALGLVHILKYLNKEINKKDLVRTWVQDDLKYAKRQLTWFKKQHQIIWYDKYNTKDKLINTLSSWLKK